MASCQPNLLCKHETLCRSCFQLGLSADGQFHFSSRSPQGGQGCTLHRAAILQTDRRTEVGRRKPGFLVPSLPSHYIFWEQPLTFLCTPVSSSLEGEQQLCVLTISHHGENRLRRQIRRTALGSEDCHYTKSHS